MPFMKISYRSDWVGKKDIGIFYPAKAPNAQPMRKPTSYSLPEGGKYQVLWLLHGGGGDFGDWALNSMILRACEEAQLFVVMPTIQDFHQFKIELGDIYQCIAKELPEFMYTMFPVSPLREDNFIAGLSLGGYLAYRIALNNPTHYSCVGSFSSPLDIETDIRNSHGRPGYPKPEEIPGTDRDVLWLAEKLKAEGAELPKLFQACGTEDFTWDMNMTARTKFRELELDHTWWEAPGTHNFDFWDRAFRQYLSWLPLKHGLSYPPADIKIERGGRFYAD